MRHHEPTRAYVARRTAEGLSKKDIMRCLKHHLPRWWPTDGATRLFDPMTVPVTRYRYRAANIPTPWQRPSTTPA